MKNNTILQIARSGDRTADCMYSVDQILDWVEEKNKNLVVSIQKTTLSGCTGWFYDRSEGCIHNQNHSFFTITGLKKQMPNGQILSQPILLQREIGFLGIICREFDGVMYFLMQAKIEPGNINKIQISPTIQATKSNFMQKHGGAKPPYLDYFSNASKYEIVVDQIQSEQSSRFYKKRNRNIIIRVEEDVPVLPSHRWMTLGQIKQLMWKDNLVNMDTRTVLSCIPYSKCVLNSQEQMGLSEHFADQELFQSVFVGALENQLPKVYQYINNCKMFSDGERELVPLHSLENWDMGESEIVCRNPYPFKVIFCDIAIEGREVKQWTQPLLEACGIATFGLICCKDQGVLKFLVKATAEAGCFDDIELGPTVQREAVPLFGESKDVVMDFFEEKLLKKEGVVFDHLLSEEGGRFYQEQNRNILMRVERSELPQLPEGYFLLDYKTLNELVQVNNTLNIQLRNLLSLLEV